jgi:hypothetical protein
MVPPAPRARNHPLGGRIVRAVTASDLLRRAAKLGRMTVEDIAQLASVFSQVARRQVSDARVGTGRRMRARRSGRR